MKLSSPNHLFTHYGYAVLFGKKVPIFFNAETNEYAGQTLFYHKLFIFLVVAQYWLKTFPAENLNALFNFNLSTSFNTHLREME